MFATFIDDVHDYFSTHPQAGMASAFSYACYLSKKLAEVILENHTGVSPNNEELTEFLRQDGYPENLIPLIVRGREPLHEYIEMVYGPQRAQNDPLCPLAMKYLHGMAEAHSMHAVMEHRRVFAKEYTELSLSRTHAPGREVDPETFPMHIARRIAEMDEQLATDLLTRLAIIEADLFLSDPRPDGADLIGFYFRADRIKALEVLNEAPYMQDIFVHLVKEAVQQDPARIVPMMAATQGKILNLFNSNLPNIDFSKFHPDWKTFTAANFKSWSETYHEPALDGQVHALQLHQWQPSGTFKPDDLKYWEAARRNTSHGGQSPLNELCQLLQQAIKKKESSFFGRLGF